MEKKRKYLGKGYFYDPERQLFRVRILIDGKRKFLGSYSNEYEAMAVYNRAKEVYNRAKEEESKRKGKK
jgi:hypothetical protein